MATEGPPSPQQGDGPDQLREPWDVRRRPRVTGALYCSAVRWDPGPPARRWRSSPGAAASRSPTAPAASARWRTANLLVATAAASAYSPARGAGGRGDGPGQLDAPEAVLFRGGALLIADTGNRVLVAAAAGSRGQVPHPSSADRD